MHVVQISSLEAPGQIIVRMLHGDMFAKLQNVQLKLLLPVMGAVSVPGPSLCVVVGLWFAESLR